MFYFKKCFQILASLLGIFAMLACSNEVEVPKLRRPQSVMIEACRNMDLDLRNLKESSVRKFVDCLDGGEGRVKEYKALLDSLNSKDLEVLLKIYNRHMVDESRFKKALELIHKMYRAGLLDEIAINLAKLVDTGVAKEFFVLLKNFYGDDRGESDPGILWFNQVFVEVVRRDWMTDFIFGLTKTIDSGRARMLAHLLSQSSESENYKLEQVVDEIANALLHSMESGGFHEVSSLLSDPMNHRVFSSILAEVDGSTAGVNSYFEYITDSSQGKNRLWDIIQLTRLTDRPALCFSDSGNPRRVDNIFDLGLTEVKVRGLRSSEELASFYIEEAPFHLKNLEYQCKLPAGIHTRYESFIDLIQGGYGPQVNQMELSFDQFHRLGYLKRLIGSPQLNSISNLVQNSKNRNILAYVLDIMTKDMGPAEFGNLARINLLMSLEDLDWKASLVWMETHSSGEVLGIAREYFETQKKGLIDFLLWLDQQAKTSDLHSKASADLRLFLADYEFVKSPGIQVTPILRKMLGSKESYRRALKNFARSLVRNWEEETGGISDLMAAVSKSMEFSKDRPFQEFFSDLLSDKEFVAEVNPLLLRLVDSKEFQGALGLTSQLAKNGDFTRLLLFFYDLSVNMPLEPLSSKPLGKTYDRFRGNYRDYYSSYQYTPNSLASSYQACYELLRHSDAWNSNYIRNMAACLNPEGDPGLDEILSVLEGIYLDGGKNVLDVIGKMLTDNFIRSPLFFQGLEDLKQIHRTGTLDRLFEFLLSFRSGGRSELLKIGGSLLANMCNNENEIASGAWVADLLASETAPDAAKSSLSLLLEERENAYPSFSLAPRDIKPENWSIIRDQFQNWKDGVRSEIGQDLNEEYLYVKAREFKEHQDEYLYGQGLYEFPGTTNNQKLNFYSKHLVQILNYASRGESVYALAKAFSDLDDANYPWKEFFDWATSEARLVRYWQGSNKTPFLRIVTPLEQAEILVQHSRIPVAHNMPVLGVHDVGTFFQIELAKSKDLKKTLSKLKSKIKLGLSYAKLFGKKSKWVHLRNIEENFSILEEMERRGYLEFFAQIYRQLYLHTPDGDRVQNPERVYSSLVHEPMKMGIFTHLSYIYSNLKKQGLEEEVIRSGIDFFKSLSRMNSAGARNLFLLLVKEENTSGLITKLMRALVDSSVELSFSEGMSTSLGVMKLSPNPSLLIPLVKQISESGDSQEVWIRYWLDKVLDSEGEFFRMINNIHYLTQEDLVAIREVSDLISRQSPWVESVLKELFVLWKQDPKLLEDFLEEFRSWRQGNREQIPEFLLALKSSIEMAKQGLLPVMSQSLRNDDVRRAFALGICEIAEKEKLEQLLDLIEKFKDGQSLDKIFEMLERHFP